MHCPIEINKWNECPWQKCIVYYIIYISEVADGHKHLQRKGALSSQTQLIKSSWINPYLILHISSWHVLTDYASTLTTLSNHSEEEKKLQNIFLSCALFHLNQSDRIHPFPFCDTALCHFLVAVNLIGLLHPLPHDDSSSYKHNVTLLYSTQIWNHLLPSLGCFIRISWRSNSTPTPFFFVPLPLSNHHTEHAARWLWSQSDLCRHFLFCYASQKS